MGAKGARCSMNTKGALRTILSTLHPNTILIPNLDSNAHPQPSEGGGKYAIRIFPHFPHFFRIFWAGPLV